MRMRSAKLFFLSVMLLGATSGFASTALAQSTVATSPESNLSCWTQDACTFDVDQDGKADGRWDVSSSQAKQVCGGTTYGYCYGEFKDFTLGVSLLGAGTNGVVTTASDLGDYINKMYVYLLGFAVIVCIVMIMIGGTQYVLAAGSGNITEAKKRMTNAVIGLVLLMFATTILFTVNPHLIALELPSIPKVRSVVFYDENTSCEYFLNGANFVDTTGTDTKAYGLEDDSGNAVTSGACGDAKAKVVTDPLGNDISSEEQTCRWTTCEDPGSVNGVSFGKSCVELSGTDQCIGCWEVAPGSSFVTGLSASAGTCAQLNPPKGSIPDGQTASCEYSSDTFFAGTASKVTGLCAAMTFDCTKISTCDDYDSAVAACNGSVSHCTTLDSFEAPGYWYDYSVHKSVCEANECGVPGGCVQSISSTIQAAALTPVGATVSAISSAISAVFGSASSDALSGVDCISATP